MKFWAERRDSYEEGDEIKKLQTIDRIKIAATGQFPHHRLLDRRVQGRRLNVASSIFHHEERRCL
jgi:hypothetical protein